MNEIDLIMNLIMVAGGTIGALLAHRYRLFRRIRRVRRRRISELGDNVRARVTGTVQPYGPLLESAMTGRECVFYRVQVTGTQPGKTTMKPLIDESRGVPFFVEDETGRALIDPMDARVDLVADAWSDEHSFDVPTPRTDALLERHGFGSLSHAWRSNLRMRESVIVVGDRLTLVGFGVREGDPTTSAYRTGATQLRMGGSVKHPLWMTKHHEALDG